MSTVGSTAKTCCAQLYQEGMHHRNKKDKLHRKGSQGWLQFVHVLPSDELEKGSEMVHNRFDWRWTWAEKEEIGFKVYVRQSIFSCFKT